MSVCLGPETHIPKKTHTFSFQVSRNEGSVCLRTRGRGRAGQGGQGRAGARAICLTNRGRGRGLLGRQGQGRALKRAARAGQG